MTTPVTLDELRRIAAPLLIEAAIEFELNRSYADPAAPQPRSGRQADTTPTTQPAATFDDQRGGPRPHQGRTEQEHTPALAGQVMGG